MPRIVAIIPARGGSKRIPKKNIKLFFGEPLITYTLHKLVNLSIFDEIIVSTDDAEIAKISQDCGASTHQRSPEISGDHTPTDVVLENIVNVYSLNQDICCLIYPTSVLIPGTYIHEGYKIIKRNPGKIVFSCAKFTSPPQRGFTLNNGVPSSLNPEFRYTRTQDLPDIYYDIGGFYWMYGKNCLKNPFSKAGNAVLVPEIYAQDIDNEQDWLLAEVKYKYITSLT
jgi:pseudaminic acid cytidylyltransferase